MKPDLAKEIERLEREVERASAANDDAAWLAADNLLVELLTDHLPEIRAALALAGATSEKYRAYEERSNEAMRNVAGGGVKDFGLREWDNAVSDACMAEDRALTAYRSTLPRSGGA